MLNSEVTALLKKAAAHVSDVPLRQEILAAADRVATQPTTHKALPVAGYSSQSDMNVALANEGKQLEERVLRWLEKLAEATTPPQRIELGAVITVPGSKVCDPRFLALGKTNIQQGFMWAIRGIFQPSRVTLPEDVG